MGLLFKILFMLKFNKEFEQLQKSNKFLQVKFKAFKETFKATNSRIFTSLPNWKKVQHGSNTVFYTGVSQREND